MNFSLLCEKTLENLAEIIENNDSDSIFDVEYSDGILSISHEKTKKNFVINRHSASQKIWYSSPISGADYFSFNAEKNDWLNVQNQNLNSKLFAELQNFPNFKI